MIKEKDEFLQSLEIRKEHIDQILRDYFEQMKLPAVFPVLELKKAMEYSLLQSGKRFRPALCLLLSEALGVGPQKVTPFACAIEMTHTYSLIHDDLPCMDNDDFRRGEPTNHKIFGESTALLAGDALLAEAFVLLAHAYDQEPKVALQLIGLLGKAAGVEGMIGGQAIDLKAQEQLPTLENLDLMHNLKTGALIRACCEGTAVVCGLPSQSVDLCRDFGAALGLAFQLSDDIIDSQDGKIEKGSFPDLLGLENTRKYLSTVSQKARGFLIDIGIAAGPLHELVKYNQMRLR